MNKVRQLARLIRNSSSTVFFGGAGVSTASGLPDFRSDKGIYNQGISVERMLTPGFMTTERELFFKFYRQYFTTGGIEPNACHKVLATMESDGLLDMIITQNIDNLHQKAGSENVVELHGNSTNYYCMSCGNKYSEEEALELGPISECTKCSGLVRPDIVLYEEGLSREALQSAMDGIRYSDLLIIGGTSLNVYPAAGLVDYQKHGGKSVLINLGETFRDDRVDLLIREDLEEVFKTLAEELELEY